MRRPELDSNFRECVERSLSEGKYKLRIGSMGADPVVAEAPGMDDL